MIVYVVRHAWAGHYGDPRWPDDRDRPLSPEGRERFVEVAEQLVDGGFRPDAVATSPLVRCRQTAEVVAEASPSRPEVFELEALSPGSDLPGVLAWTGKQHAESEVALVGHAPDVGHLVGACIGDPLARIRFAKGAVAAIGFDGPVAPGGGQLRWLATAKLLGC